MEHQVHDFTALRDAILGLYQQPFSPEVMNAGADRVRTTNILLKNEIGWAAPASARKAQRRVRVTGYCRVPSSVAVLSVGYSMPSCSRYVSYRVSS